MGNNYTAFKILTLFFSFSAETTLTTLTTQKRQSQREFSPFPNPTTTQKLHQNYTLSAIPQELDIIIHNFLTFQN